MNVTPETLKKLWLDLDSISEMEVSVYADLAGLTQSLKEAEALVCKLKEAIEALHVTDMAARKRNTIDRLREACGAKKLSWYSVASLPAEGSVYVAKPDCAIARYDNNTMGRSDPSGGTERGVYRRHALYALAE